MEIKLKLKIKDIEIELSEKEVYELRDIIKLLFPEEKQIQYVPYYPYIWTEPWKITPYWTITCGTNTIIDNDTETIDGVVYKAELT